MIFVHEIVFIHILVDLRLFCHEHLQNYIYIINIAILLYMCIVTCFNNIYKLFICKYFILIIFIARNKLLIVLRIF